ncbi:hypothetical protein AB0I41_20265, partial [Micromonospora sp. NPDC050200]
GASPPAGTRTATPAPTRRAPTLAGRPARPGTPHPRTPETLVVRGTQPLRDRVAAPVAAVVDPVADPVVGTLAPALDPLLRSLDPVLASLDPVLASLDPVLAPLDPVLAPLDPVLAPLDPVLASLDPVLAPLDPVLGALRPPVVVPPPAERAPLADDASMRPPAAAVTSPGAAVPAAPSATSPHSGRPATWPALAGPARWSMAERSPESVGATARPVRHPVRPEVTAPPAAPATDTGGVGSPGGAHQVTGDASADAWTPPPRGVRVCRPDGPDRPPSRSPRPGSRPA